MKPGILKPRQPFRSSLPDLPPYSVQEEIVSEVEGYQKIIDGARVSDQIKFSGCEPCPMAMAAQKVQQTRKIFFSRKNGK